MRRLPYPLAGPRGDLRGPRDRVGTGPAAGRRRPCRLPPPCRPPLPPKAGKVSFTALGGQPTRKLRYVARGGSGSRCRARVRPFVAGQVAIAR